jgi:hypothetical protein
MYIYGVFYLWERVTSTGRYVSEDEFLGEALVTILGLEILLSPEINNLEDKDG